MTRVLSLLAGLVLLTGCSATLGDLPLPGTGVSGETITVVADFDEALNLATGATVKVDGVDAGRVQAVTTEDFRAEVEMVIRTSAELRQGATARLRYSTPLGELFVDVENPDGGSLLADGSELDEAFTSTAPTVEDALAQASLLVNGGGLAQLQTVTEELRAAIGGREDTVRSVLRRSTDVLDQLDAATGDLDRALRSLDSLAGTLAERQETIEGVLADVRPAARALTRSTPELSELLDEVESFAGVADATVRATREDLLTALRLAGPVLQELADTGPDYGDSLEQLVELGEVLQGVAPGDYLNISFDLRLDEPPGLPSSGGGGAGAGASGGGGNGGGGGGGPLPDVPDLLGPLEDLVGGLLS